MNNIFSFLRSFFFSQYFFSVFGARLLGLIAVSLQYHLLSLRDFERLDYIIVGSLVFLPIVTICMPDAYYNFIRRKFRVRKYLFFLSFVFIVIISLMISLYQSSAKNGSDFYYIFVFLLCASSSYFLKQIVRVLGLKILYIFNSLFYYIIVLFYLLYVKLEGLDINYYSVINVYILSYVVVFIMSLSVIYMSSRKIVVSHDYPYIATRKFFSYSLALVPGSFIFNYLINLFRFIDLSNSYYSLLVLNFRVSSIQIVLNTVLFGIVQDYIYLQDKESLDKPFEWKWIFYMYFFSFLLGLLITPVLFCFIYNNVPHVSDLQVSFLFVSAISVYGFSSVFSIILNKADYFFVNLFLSVLFFVFVFVFATHWPDYFLQILFFFVVIHLVLKYFYVKYLNISF